MRLLVKLALKVTCPRTCSIEKSKGVGEVVEGAAILIPGKLLELTTLEALSMVQFVDWQLQEPVLLMP